MFENGIPKPVQQMLITMLRTAAPELAEQVDGIAEVVRSFKDQNDRIEKKLDLVMKHLDITEQSHDEITGQSIAQIGNGRQPG